jgi:hypothetical protein
VAVFDPEPLKDIAQELSDQLPTGRKPTKRTFEMVCFYLSGWASAHDMERHIEVLPKPA